MGWKVWPLGRGWQMGRETAGMFDVVALGELLIDFTQTGITENGIRLYARNPGGAPANVLAVLSKYAEKCAFIGKVGKDQFGEYLLDTLVGLGIDCRGLMFDPIHNTTLAFVSIDQSGDRSFTFYRRYGADCFLTEQEIAHEVILNSRIFHFGTISMTQEPVLSATLAALRLARENRVLVSFDPNYRELLWECESDAVDAMRLGLSYADIVKFSLEEAQMLTKCESKEDCLDSLLHMGVSFAVISLGEDGCTYATKTHRGACKVPADKTIDTTGAGDILWGTFLHGLVQAGGIVEALQPQELDELMLTACTAASMSTEKSGAIPSIPEWSCVQNRLIQIHQQWR